MRFNKKGGNISTDDLKNIKITLALDPLPATNCPPPPTSGAPGPNIVDKIGPVMPGFPALTPEQIKQSLAISGGLYKTFFKPKVMDPLDVKKDLQHGMHNVPDIELNKKIEEELPDNIKKIIKIINDLQTALTVTPKAANGTPPVTAGGRKKRTRRKVRKRRAKTLRRKRYTKKRRKLRRRKSRRRRR